MRETAATPTHGVANSVGGLLDRKKRREEHLQSSKKSKKKKKKDINIYIYIYMFLMPTRVQGYLRRIDARGTDKYSRCVAYSHSVSRGQNKEGYDTRSGGYVLAPAANASDAPPPLNHNYLAFAPKGINNIYRVQHSNTVRVLRLPFRHPWV